MEGQKGQLKGEGRTGKFLSSRLIYTYTSKCMIEMNIFTIPFSIYLYKLKKLRCHTFEFEHVLESPKRPGNI